MQKISIKRINKIKNRNRSSYIRLRFPSKQHYMRYKVITSMLIIIFRPTIQDNKKFLQKIFYIGSRILIIWVKVRFSSHQNTCDIKLTTFERINLYYYSSRD